MTSQFSEVKPWKSIVLPKCDIPHMLTDEEKQYYIHAGMSYRGIGAVVELGCWLGCSTWHILHGLQRSGNFNDQHLIVIDDFIWRSSWMDRHAPLEMRTENHESFRPKFEKILSQHSGRMDVRTQKIIAEDGNDDLPTMCWAGDPIELCFIDCGRTYEVNQAWYEILSPYFIPGHTLVVMEDWGHHRDIPKRDYNQTKMFTDSKSRELGFLNEVQDGTLAAFKFSSQAFG